MSAPDFERPVHLLLGLPFDALDLAGAERRLREAVRERRRCFLSTPNLNFLVAAQSDAAFRDSVLHSDLSVADGMPLIWLARLLGLPLPERVAGSALFERLRRPSPGQAPIKLYFFGGPDGAAARAGERLNAEQGGLVCVGHDAPGYASVAEMSAEPRIARINASGADFVVVALGARKGQAWIEHNRARLQAPLLSHLGAVVNFVAGTVRRAPLWMQASGLEWLWRVREEPALWRRYGGDGLALAGLLATRVLPQLWQARRHRPDAAALAAARAELDEAGTGRRVLRLHGAWVAANLGALRQACARAAGDARPLHLDLAPTRHLDAAALALLALLRADRLQRGAGWSVAAPADALRRALHRACADELLAAAGTTPDGADAATGVPA